VTYNRAITTESPDLPEEIGRLPVLTQPVEDLRRQLHLADCGRRNSCRHEL
jgi:hypothetical protein